METTEREGGTGGKFRKRSLRRIPYSPYDRPPLAARGAHYPPPETDARVSGWFSKLVDPASRVVVKSACRLLSAFSKGLAAPPGEHIGAIEEVSKEKSSAETREQGENPSAVMLSIHHDGSDRAEQELISPNDHFSELEQLLKQKRFSRAEIDRMAELLNSRIIEPSTLPPTDYNNKGMINEDSSINSSSSNQAVNHEERGKKKADPSELEGQMEELVNLHENAICGEHVNISEEGFDSPIEIARAYMGLKPRKAAPSPLGLRSQICQRDSPFNLRSSNAVVIASRSPVSFPVFPTDSGNDCMAQKARGRSTLCKLSRSPYCRTFTTTNSREYSPCKGSNVEPTRSLEWTPSLSNIRHSDHGQALKRGGLERDAWRVRQRSSLKELNLPTQVDTPSKFVLSQVYKHDIDVKGLDNLDCKIPSSVLHVPPHSVEMARKILHQLDKLSPSPQNKSSEKQVVVGDAPFSISSIRASHVGSLKTKANNDSTKLLNLKGSRILEEPSSNFTRITSSTSPNKDKVEGEASLMYDIAGAEVASCLGMNGSGMSASVTNHSLKPMEPTVQSALNDKVEPTKADHGILASLKQPMEKSFEQSFGNVPTSRLMHIDSDAKASVATTSAVGATPKKEDTVSPLKFGSELSTYNATNPISTGISTRLNDGSLSVASSSTVNGAPKFQFGTGNSTSYSFTGLSAVSSSIGIFSSLYPYSEGLSTTGLSTTGFSTSSASGGLTFQFATNSSQNTAGNFGAVA